MGGAAEAPRSSPPRSASYVSADHCATSASSRHLSARILPALRPSSYVRPHACLRDAALADSRRRARNTWGSMSATRGAAGRAPEADLIHHQSTNRPRERAHVSGHLVYDRTRSLGARVPISTHRRFRCPGSTGILRPKELELEWRATTRHLAGGWRLARPPPCQRGGRRGGGDHRSRRATSMKICLAAAARSRGSRRRAASRSSRRSASSSARRPPRRQASRLRAAGLRMRRGRPAAATSSRSGRRRHVLVLYLLPEAIEQFREQLLACLRRGTRVVCNTWGIAGLLSSSMRRVRAARGRA